MNLVKSNFKRIRVERTTVVIQGPIKVNDRETRWFRNDFAVWSPLDRKREIKWTKETAQTSNLKRNRVSEQSQRSAFNAFFWNDFRIDVYVYKAKNKKEKKMEIEKKRTAKMASDRGHLIADVSFQPTDHLERIHWPFRSIQRGFHYIK